VNKCEAVAGGRPDNPKEVFEGTLLELQAAPAAFVLSPLPLVILTLDWGRMTEVFRIGFFPGCTHTTHSNVLE